MGKSFFDEYPSVRQLFEQAADVTHKDLKRLCFEGPESTLVQTDNVQPAVTLVNLACLQVLREEGVSPAATAGNSLGEYAALCAAGSMSFADTMRLVNIRGAAMKEAAERHPGGMTAVFGLDIETVAAICAEIQDLGSVEVGNQNSPLQIVMTGEKEALVKASQLAKQKGAKLIVPLKVSGAWHSRFMAEARDRMRAALAECTIVAPSMPVIANVTGSAHPAEADGIRDLLMEQLVSPVLWLKSLRTLIDAGHRTFLEVGPGKVLTGLMRDVDRDLNALNVPDTDGLAKLRSARPELSL
jgi:[acyl-carrier-protein] S-malonyltransferase